MTERETLVLDMLTVGRSLQVIVARSDWSTYEIRQFAEARGFVIDKEGCPSKVPVKGARRPSPPAVDLPLPGAPTRAFVPSPTPTRPAAPATPEPVRQAPDEQALRWARLLARGLSSEHKHIKARAAAVQKSFEQLVTAFDVQREKDAAKYRAARARQAAADEVARARRAAAAEVDRLTEQLAAAKARLRSGTGGGSSVLAAPTSPAGGAKSFGLDPKVVRAWAASVDMPCNQAGRIQSSVVQAYLAAQGGGS